MQVERSFELSLLDDKLSGGRVSNAWVTCPGEGDNTAKVVLIPHEAIKLHDLRAKGVIRSWMDPRLISWLVR